MSRDVRGLVEHLFRDQAGRIAATLTRILGPENLDTVEDVVQEALLKALRQWPFTGVPENPGAWLTTVARHRAIDRLRRRNMLETKLRGLAAWDPTPASPDLRFSDELGDDRLQMMFTCCHPSIPRVSQVALTLKTVGGFGVSEIARNFLTNDATIAQRLVRAKRVIREQRIPFEVPGPLELPMRLDSVLDVLYLLFNEGYAAHQGEKLVRRDLVAEALRLGTLLTGNSVTGVPKTHALLALMLFQGARLAARTDRDGRLLVLADQNRELWDRAMVAAAFREFRRATRGSDLSVYHHQAAIAACHASAPVPKETDWPQILREYDLLYARHPSAIVALNRAVAVAKIEGYDAGLAALDPLAGEPALKDYYLYSATRGEFLRNLGRVDEATAEFGRALAMVCSDPEREFLRGRIRECRRPS